MVRRPLISADYAAQNRLLHERRRRYGGNGGRYVEHALALIALFRPASVLDYGCGKGGLMAAVQARVGPPQMFKRKARKAALDRHRPPPPVMPEWRMYDPAIPGCGQFPEEAADLLICTDVMEHVEPEYLDATIDAQRRLGLKAAFFTFALRASNKTLPDGRNTHLIVEGRDFWRARLARRWHLAELAWKNDDTYLVLALPR